MKRIKEWVSKRKTHISSWSLQKKLVSLVLALAFIVTMVLGNVYTAKAADTRYVDAIIKTGSTTSKIRLNFGTSSPQAWVVSNNHSITLTGSDGTTKNTTKVKGTKLDGNYYYVKVTITIPHSYYFVSGSSEANYTDDPSACQFTTPTGRTSPTTQNGMPHDYYDTDKTYTMTLYWLNSVTAVSKTAGSSTKTWPFSQKTQTVKFYNASNTAISTQTVAYGSAATAPTSPTRTGYTFNGWDTSYSKVTSDLNIHPKWTAITAAVKYDANGGSGAPGDQTKTYGTDLTLSSTKPTKSGYAFTGWLCSGDSKTYQAGATFSLNPTSTGLTYTMKAQWKAMNYTIKYNANGGTGVMSDQTGTVDATDTLTANSFARPSYTFMGWSTDSEATTATYANKASVTNLAEGDGSITLYAVWKKTDASFDTTTLIHDEDMFTGDGNLEGENGTTYDKNHVDSSYAKVDESGDPGYFTRK